MQWKLQWNMHLRFTAVVASSTGAQEHHLGHGGRHREATRMGEYRRHRVTMEAAALVQTGQQAWQCRRQQYHSLSIFRGPRTGSRLGLSDRINYTGYPLTLLRVLEALLLAFQPHRLHCLLDSKSTILIR